MPLLNYNIISIIFSFLPLEQISNILIVKNKNKQLINYVILALGFYYKINYKIIEAKLNNYQHRCGKCHDYLNNDWALILGNKNCGYCLSSINFKIECCNKCTNVPIKRGYTKDLICIQCNQNVLLFGINFLS